LQTDSFILLLDSDRSAIASMNSVVTIGTLGLTLDFWSGRLAWRCLRDLRSLITAEGGIGVF
jgi:hypothetical protein